MVSSYAPHVRRPAAAVFFLIALTIMLVAGCGRRSARDYINAGDQAMRDNQVGNAQEDYEAAVKLAPNDAQAHLKLGDFYMFEHNYPAAEVEYTKAAGLQPLKA